MLRPRIAVIGGGTLGLFTAARLAAHADVEVFEADYERTVGREGLVGASPQVAGHRGALEGWASTLGGTSTIWGGQLLPWEPWEFAGGSGRPAWPVPYEEIEAGYRAVAADLGLDATHARVHEHGIAGPYKVPSSGEVTSRYSTWMPRAVRDMSRNRAVARRLKGVTIHRDRAVARVERDGAGFALETVGPDGGRGRSAADAVVVAAGTLGTSRLLTDGLDTPARPRVGQGFMDHLSMRVAEYTVTDWHRFRRYASHAYEGRVRATSKLVTTPALLERTGALPGYAHWEFDISGLDRRRDAPAVAAAVADGLRSHRRPLPQGTRIYLRVDVEQPPDSCRSLHWRTGGKAPRLDLEWSASSRERASAVVIGEAAARHLEDVGIGADLARWIRDDPGTDTFHMMGGATMATDPDQGVVDPWGGVHGVDRAWVVGAAVFPSGGVANPTFTAMALATRTAARIEEALA
ncbi:GMC oxidoreductase [Demequina soli]|uniref:GMC oxidoreductase n=1 Tax=Demequina soli TaxID=1638987 RepID=UPI0007821EA1|nr:GMC oxidoreductase [Demequina soli]